MPSLPIVRATNASIFYPYRPVALFVGGTAGIGEGMARAFAQHARGDADVFIAGRNRAAGEAILASMPTVAPKDGVPAPRREFVECDATLMRNVRSAAAEIKAKTDRVNYMVITSGMLGFQGRDETDEGIDRKLALHYYARWTFINELCPLMQKAKDDGEDAKVMSVFAAGSGRAIDLDDLGLKKNFSLAGAARSAPTYNDCMIESFAERNPTLSFLHAHPGMVLTSAGSNSGSTTLRLLSPLLKGFLHVAGVSKEDCAEHLLHGLYTAQPGASRVDRKGDDLQGKWLYSGEEQRKTLWNHTVQATGSTEI